MPGENDEVRYLLILSDIYTNSGMTRLTPGTLIPSLAAPEKAASWVEAGSARWVTPESPQKQPTAAKMLTAKPGLPGVVSGGEHTTEELIGRVPDTPQRKRRRKK